MSIFTVDLGVMQRFAPPVFLHPYEQHLPTSVESYFKLVNLVNANGNILSQTVTGDVLVQNNSASNYLTFANQRWPTAADDFSTGDLIVPGSGSGVGLSQAPMYAKTRSNGPDYVDIVYCFFYAFNGFQTFRVGVGAPTYPHNLEWARFARHEADWEHVTVRISSEQKILGVHYGQHGGSAWVDSPTIVDGTHPVVYSAWNSHASYPDAGVHELDTILGSPGVQPVGWFKAVDITVNDDIHAYHQPEPFYSTIAWTPWIEENQLVSLDANPEASKWLDFLGRFGSPNLDNTHIDSPPGLPHGAGGELMLIAQAGKLFGGLSDKYMHGDGPASPEQQSWWGPKET
jgi:hypothetical protein